MTALGSLSEKNSASLGASGKLLENSFFNQQDQRLIENLRKMKAMKETKEELAKVSGIRNDAVLQKLIDLDVRPETLASLAMVPLIEVAWADGEIDERERKSVLSAIGVAGMDADSIDYALIEQWLKHKPPPALLDAWVHYMKGLCEVLSPAEAVELRTSFLGQAKAIADASGGILGLGIGSRISASELAMLNKLESVFERCK